MHTDCTPHGESLARLELEHRTIALWKRIAAEVAHDDVTGCRTLADIALRLKISLALNDPDQPDADKPPFNHHELDRAERILNLLTRS